MAQLRAKKAAEERVKLMEAKLAANADADAADELEVELQLAVLEHWVLTVCMLLDAVKRTWDGRRLLPRAGGLTRGCTPSLPTRRA